MKTLNLTVHVKCQENVVDFIAVKATAEVFVNFLE